MKDKSAIELRSARTCRGKRRKEDEMENLRNREARPLGDGCFEPADDADNTEWPKAVTAAMKKGHAGASRKFGSVEKECGSTLDVLLIGNVRDGEVCTDVALYLKEFDASIVMCREDVVDVIGYLQAALTFFGPTDA